MQIKLTAGETQALRDKVRRWGLGPVAARRYPIEFKGGPLDGVNSSIINADTPEMVSATQVTPRGLIRLRYRHEADRVWRFDETGAA